MKRLIFLFSYAGLGVGFLYLIRDYISTIPDWQGGIIGLLLGIVCIALTVITDIMTDR